VLPNNCFSNLAALAAQKYATRLQLFAADLVNFFLPCMHNAMAATYRAHNLVELRSATALRN